MLAHLTIRGLAVIDHLSIDFASGFNVITGETGAGKSILIKALGLLLGAKAQAETVRQGFDDATVHGVFSLPTGHPVARVLQELGLVGSADTESATDDSFDLVVRRQIFAKGRSQAWVNDQPLALPSLKLIGETLIDILGQHENHRIFEQSYHTYCLDQFLNDKKLSPAVKDAYQSVSAQFRALKAHVEELSTKLHGQDYLRFRINEMEKFNPSAEDYQKQLTICEQGRNSAQHQQFLAAVQSIFEPDEGRSPSAQVNDLAKLFGARADFQDLANDARQIATQLDELSFRFNRQLGGSDFSEEDLEAAESRIATYQGLFRKLGVKNIDDFMVERQKLTGELEQLETAAQYVEAELGKIRQEVLDLHKLSNQLTIARNKTKPNIVKALEREMRELAMPGARFDIELIPVQKSLPTFDVGDFGENVKNLALEVLGLLSELSENGLERVQFLLAANPGEPFFPLHKIASGGEASRIMLALKRVLSAGADSCLLVFDEIDAGISGKTADIVGGKLKDLSKKFQVLCISHLAQVAAYAETHFRVEKATQKGRTESQIVKLSSKQSLEEVARLLSGTELTKQSLDNARVLRDRAGVRGHL